nr:CHC2 zinc finger domain-containing protein [Candidatus Woesearchaeota archaeon]
MKTPQQVLDELGIAYEIKGDNLIFTCTNPSHKDNHPSCSMDIEEGYYKCWGCGDKGNTFTLYKRLTGNTLDSGSSYSNYGGYYSTTKTTKKKSKDRGDFILEEGSELSVFNNKEVMAYLKSIGVVEDTIYDFNISYTKYCKYRSKFTQEDKKSTVFMNRILIPVYNSEGNLINIEGRAYRKGDLKVLYPKDAISDFIFNLDNCNTDEPLVIVEGIKSLLNIYNVHKNVCSFFGNTLTETKLKMLRDRGFKDIILGIDNDNAGYQMLDDFDREWDYDFRVCTSEIEGENIGDLDKSLIKSKIDSSIEYG